MEKNFTTAMEFLNETEPNDVADLGNVKSITITGVRQIDEIICEFQPDIIEASEIEIIIIARDIKDFITGKIESIPIGIIKNEEVIEFIEGVRIVVENNRIQDIPGLIDFIDSKISNFDAIQICRIGKI